MPGSVVVTDGPSQTLGHWCVGEDMNPDVAVGKPPGVARRSVLRELGAGAVAGGAGGVLATCTAGGKGTQAASATGTITLGYISPFTGSLAGFVSGDRFVIDTVAPGVAIIPPVGVQWKASTGKYPFEMKVVDNSLNKAVKIGANLEPTNAG